MAMKQIILLITGLLFCPEEASAVISLQTTTASRTPSDERSMAITVQPPTASQKPSDQTSPVTTVQSTTASRSFPDQTLTVTSVKPTSAFPKTSNQTSTVACLQTTTSSRTPSNESFAFKCLQCSGNMEECNSMSAKNVSCAIGQNRCLKVMMSKDGKESGLYGCASDRDCKMANKSCEAVKKNNARTNCMSQCCNTTSCNTPPPKSYRLKCYMCGSVKSMDDCVQNTWSGRCVEGQTKCGKFTTELIMQGKKVMVYRKGCQTEMTCKKENDLYGQACGSDDTCEFHCCEGDLCNAGSFASVSVVSLFTCTLLSFLYI